MEVRAHARDTYTVPGQQSRMSQDFAEFTEYLLLQPKENGATGKGRHVGIIGAGFAGLRCAEVLINGGARVTVLEARNRIGGRVHQTKFRENMVDMGPNWIHGTSTNPILGLAIKTGTILSQIKESPCIFKTDSQLLCKTKAAELLDILWDIILKAFKYSNEHCISISPTKSLQDFVIEEAYHMGLSFEDQALILQIAEMWGGFVGDPLDKQSLKHFWLEECLDGENLFVAGTHSRILHALAESVLEHAKIITEARVILIQNTGVENDPRVLVKTKDSRTFKFDSIVVTVPLGSLKRQSPAFCPPLPPQIDRAIDRANYSSLEKVLIEFPSAFWEPVSAQEAGRDPGSLSAAAFESFAHFLRPKYSKQNPEGWYVELLALTSPNFGHEARPTLLFTIYGPCAKYVTSQTTTLDAASQEYFNFLDSFFQPYYSLLPNYDPDNPCCRPTAVLASNWRNDELAGYGSYMNFQTSHVPTEGEREAVSLEDDLRALRQGMPERNIWIAGEHAAPFVALGTLTGAYWSGESVAVRMLHGEGLNR
ncbi:flavin monoamine oxidase family protein [Aspergillus stella-maris]|uniref:flavin monoamine oxidase family protein n=1 Tax=Aspergillus stella-maris TaxID=1810926 RepID=UPI003CCDF219